MDQYESEQTINVGTGKDLPIAELAETIRSIVCPSAALEYDASMPDGTPRKLLDVTRLHELGWTHGIELRDGIASTYEWFCEHEAAATAT